jgi:hypothetical protein
MNCSERIISVNTIPGPGYKIIFKQKELTRTQHKGDIGKGIEDYRTEKEVNGEINKQER